jgi:hypothetical protein
MITILPATAKDIIELRKTMREEDRREVLNLGPCLRRILWDSFNYTHDPKTIFVDGKLAAIFGCSGVLLGQVGKPWLLTTTVSEKYPVLFVRTYREQVAEMLKNYPVLENMVDASYAKAIKLLEMVGFSIGEPEEYGYYKKPFRRFTMVSQ